MHACIYVYVHVCGSKDNGKWLKNWPMGSRFNVWLYPVTFALFFFWKKHYSNSSTHSTEDLGKQCELYPVMHTDVITCTNLTRLFHDACNHHISDQYSSEIILDFSIK